MFVGIGTAYRSSSFDGSPKFIELIATKDIDDLENYRIYNYQNGNTSNSYYSQFNGSVNKGDKILIYYDYWNFYNFFNNTYPTTASGYAQVYDFGTTLYYGMQGGDDVFEIVYSEEDGVGGFNKDTDVVDVLGVRGEDGSGKDWDYYRGWLKRKVNKYASKTFKVNDWITCRNCFGTSSTNGAASTKYDLLDYSTNQTGNGGNSPSLVLDNMTYDEYHGALVRVKVSAPSFACGQDTVAVRLGYH